MAETEPRVTIGVPVFNGERYLGTAVESVLAQSFGDFELIISDNASSDGTEEIGRGFAARDARVVYRRNRRNVGLSANFNLLVPLARAPLFKWATSDDAPRPGYLERCVAVLDADPSVVLAYPETEFVDSEGRPLDIVDPGWNLTSPDISKRLRYAILADQYMNSVLGVIRTDALRRTRLMPRYPGGDFRLMTELLVLGKSVEVPERLYVRRIHKGSTKGNAADLPWLRRYYSGTRPEMRAAFWRLSMDRAGIVVGAPMPVRRKATLLARLAVSMAHQRRRLFRELTELL